MDELGGVLLPFRSRGSGGHLIQLGQLLNLLVDLSHGRIERKRYSWANWSCRYRFKTATSLRNPFLARTGKNDLQVVRFRGFEDNPPLRLDGFHGGLMAAAAVMMTTPTLDDRPGILPGFPTR